MESLQENVPHTVPKGPEEWFDFSETDEEKIVTESGERVLIVNQLLLSKIEWNIVCSTDATSAMLCPMFLRAVKANSEPKKHPHKMAVFLGRMGELAEASSKLNDLLMEHDITKNGETEEVEQEWQAAIQNEADLQKFWQGNGDNVYMDSRKITLPQGAALILKYWQDQLNDFVTRLASVSSDPKRAACQKAPNFKLYNSPRSVKPGRTGMTEVKTLFRFPALNATGSFTSMQREPIAELAAFFSRMEFTGGVDTFDEMAETNVVFKGLVTGEVRDRMKRAELWRPGQL